MGEQVTSRGVGNGISLIIFAGIVAELPSALAGTLELGRQGALSTFIILALIIMVVAVIAFIVFMERAQRRLCWCNIRNARPPAVWRSGDNSHLPLKLNTAGVIPPIFASSSVAANAELHWPISQATPEGGDIMATDGRLYWGADSRLIWRFMLPVLSFFCFFYTSIVFNPNDTADNLKRYGGFHSGYPSRPAHG